MTSDPEPGYFVVLQKSDGPVSEVYADRVHRVLFVDPLEVEAGVLGVLAKEPVGFPSSDPEAARGTLPRSAAWRATSQLLGVESRGSASRAVGSGFSRKFAQGVLRGIELVGPVLLIAKFVEQPARDPVLLLGRQSR